jgi:hypothetical protein
MAGYICNTLAKGLATPTEMNMNTNAVNVENFDIERNQLLQLLKQVQQRQSFGKHSFFGTINKKELGRIIWKHLDHHLKQFGAY